MRHDTVPFCAQVLRKRILFTAAAFFAVILLIGVSVSPVRGDGFDPFGCPPSTTDSSDEATEPPEQPVAQGETAQETFDPFNNPVRTVAKQPIKIELLETSDDTNAMSAERRIEAALQKPVKIEANGQPLAELLRQLSEAHQIPIATDRRELDELGIKPSTPITHKFTEISLRSALNVILEELELTYYIKDETLLITTPEEVETHLVTRVYPVTDLVQTWSEEGKSYRDSAALMDIIITSIEPGTWDTVGGPGSVDFQQVQNGYTLVASQTQQVHEQIALTIQAIRKLNACKTPDDAADDSPSLWKRSRGLLVGDSITCSAERRIETALRTTVNFDAREQTLTDVIDQLAEACKIPIIIDRRSLNDIGMDPRASIDCSFEGISLRSGLDLMLDQLHLTFIIKNEMLVITTPEEAETHLPIRIYPVTDLVRFKTEDGEFISNPDSLMATIRETIEPCTWDTVGGPGSISEMTFQNGTIFVISQTQAVHEMIADSIRSLRKTNAAMKGSEPFYHKKPIVPGNFNNSMYHGGGTGEMQNANENPQSGGLF